jgi:hypothetical protein
MADVILGFLWTTMIGASVVACAVAIAVVYATRKLD